MHSTYWAQSHATHDTLQPPVHRSEKKPQVLFTGLMIWPLLSQYLIGGHLFTQTELSKVLSFR